MAAGPSHCEAAKKCSVLRLSAREYGDMARTRFYAVGWRGVCVSAAAPTYSPSPSVLAGAGWVNQPLRGQGLRVAV